MNNLGPTPWLTLEGNESAENYMYHQNQEMKSLQESVARLFDGWQIRHWDTFWNQEKKCWTFEVYPDEQRDINEYYRNK